MVQSSQCCDVASSRWLVLHIGLTSLGLTPSTELSKKNNYHNCGLIYDHDSYLSVSYMTFADSGWLDDEMTL